MATFSMPSVGRINDLFAKRDADKTLGSTKSDFTTVISIRPKYQTINFGYMTGGDISSIKYDSRSYRSKLFDDEFFDIFAKALEKYSQNHPAAQNAQTVIVLPDECISFDSISMPTMRRSKADQSLQIIIDDLYKNSNNLQIKKTLVVQNKQYSVYALSMINKELLAKLYATCAQLKMTPQFVTFRSSAACNSVQNLRSDLKGESFLLMDMSYNYTYISFVNKGRCAGAFELPIGHHILEKSRLAAEDMLFEEPNSELLVLNAIEKAKTKTLSMMAEDSAINTAKEMGEETQNEGGISLASDSTASGEIKVMAKKQPRKLPKFLLRDMPSGREEYVCENFRLFVKWALNLIFENKDLFTDTCKKVYVNMPSEYAYAIDRANTEEEENAVLFELFTAPGVKDETLTSLDLYGGFFDIPQNRCNNF